MQFYTFFYYKSGAWVEKERTTWLEIVIKLVSYLIKISDHIQSNYTTRKIHGGIVVAFYYLPSFPHFFAFTPAKHKITPQNKQNDNVTRGKAW